MTSLERDLEVARFDKDPAHAVRHLAGAFGEAPFDERVHAVFASLAARLDVLKHLPDDNYFGTFLLKAHALHRAGRVDEAIIQLTRVVQRLPQLGLETLLASWLAATKAAGRVISAAAATEVARTLSMAGNSTIGLHRLLPGERELLRGYGDLAGALRPFEPAELVLMAVMGIYRRLGRFDDALAVAGQSDEQFVAVQRGLTLRAKGDGVAAAEVFASLAKLGGAYPAEEARSWFVAGDDARALLLIPKEVLPGDAEVNRLRQLCEAHVAGDRIHLLDQIRREETTGLFETPRDATANGLRQHRGHKYRQMAVSGWESPSNRLLFTLHATGTADPAKADYSIDTSKTNLGLDPFSNRRGSSLALWTLRDGAAVQNVPAPAVGLREAIARVAAGDSMDAVWAAAGELGRSLPASAADEVAAALIHPPLSAAFLAALPEGLYRYQVAGACVLANLPQAWKTARGVFESLVFGPVDWVSGAAITALSELAQRDASAAREILAFLLTVPGDFVKHTCEPRFWPLYIALKTLPCVPAHIDQQLEALRREITGEPAKAPEPDLAKVPSPHKEPVVELPDQQAAGFKATIKPLPLLALAGLTVALMAWL
ncbi:MAG TPA: hypothetical protein VH083_07575, partial [Myxococcales bacterium]|nr:hypothetical protein [Myxococcales bacterium]